MTTSTQNQTQTSQRQVGSDRHSVSPATLALLRALGEKIDNGTFDSIDVERLLIYGRPMFDATSWLREFADGVAHTIRNRGKIHEATARLIELDEKQLSKKFPLGSIGCPEETMGHELSRFLGQFGYGPIRQRALNKFLECLAILGQRLDFDFSDSCTCVIVTQEEVTLGIYEERKATICILKAANTCAMLESSSSLIHLQDNYAELIRNSHGTLSLHVFDKDVHSIGWLNEKNSSTMSRSPSA